MNLKKLNEDLAKLLFHELSPETRQWATDERKARYLAAKATAEEAKLIADTEKEKADNEYDKWRHNKVRTHDLKIKKEIEQIINEICKRWGYSDDHFILTYNFGTYSEGNMRIEVNKDRKNEIVSRYRSSSPIFDLWDLAAIFENKGYYTSPTDYYDVEKEERLYVYKKLPKFQ